jgi:hypothetical protein
VGCALSHTVVWCPHVFFTIHSNVGNEDFTFWGKGWADS